MTPRSGQKTQSPSVENDSTRVQENLDCKRWTEREIISFSKVATEEKTGKVLHIFLSLSTCEILRGGHKKQLFYSDLNNIKLKNISFYHFIICTLSPDLISKGGNFSWLIQQLEVVKPLGYNQVSSTEIGNVVFVVKIQISGHIVWSEKLLE